MKKRLILSAIILLLSAATLTTAVFGLFTALTAEPMIYNISAEEEEVITEIDSEYRLRLYAFDRYYNSGKQVSDKGITGNRGQRESLKLVNDISLSYDLTINRDINLDLNGYTLDLNGYDLIIEHTYDGALVIQDGELSGSGSNFIINTPNAVIKEVGLVLNGVTRTIVSQSEALLVDTIFSLAEISGVYLSDIELMQNYYNYDITFSWTSSNAAVISDSGKLTLQENETIVNMTLTISSPLFASAHSITYPVTIAAAGDDRIAYGIAELNAFFDRFKYGQENATIYNEMNLPEHNAYFNLDYSYNAELIEYAYEEDRSDYIYEDDIVGYTLKKNTYSRKIRLFAEIDNNDGVVYSHTIILNLVVETNFDIAKEIVNSLDLYYVVNEESDITLPTYEELVSYGVKQAPDFTFTNNQGENGVFYYIEDGKVKVNELPPTDLAIYINMGFTFVANTPEYVVMPVQIFYVEANDLEGEEGLDRYDILYPILNQRIIDITGGKTYQSFTMPSELADTDITYLLQLPEDFPADAITLHVGDGQVLFFIDTAKVPTKDTTIIIGYHFEGSETPYTRQSFFILPGIINNRPDGISDTLLYNAVLAGYDADDDGVLTVEEAKEEKALFRMPEEIAGMVSGFKGVEFLINTKGFDFSGRGFTANDAQYLRKLNKLTYLNLSASGLDNQSLSMFEGLNYLTVLDISGNDFTTLQYLSLNHTVKELYMSDGALTDISAIGYLESVKILHIENNAIRLFDALLSMDMLEEVYLYNEENPVIDLYYGAKGSFNISTYNLLLNKGVTVYNDYQNGEYKEYQTDDDTEEAFAVIESIVYYTVSRNQILVPDTIIRYDAETETFLTPYQIIWDYSNLPGASSGVSNGIRTITHLTSAGRYELYAGVTVNGVTVYKIFMITVE